MSSVETEIKEALDSQAKNWNEFKAANSTRMSVLENELGALLKSQNRKSAIPGQQTIATPTQSFYDAKSKQRVPVLVHGERLSQSTGTPSLGRILRGMVTGGAADDARELADERKSLSIFDDSAGGYSVSGELSNQWIDALRAEMVLSKAGVTTVPMNSKTLTVAKITADPAVSWKGENASITATQPTFGASTLDARTVVCLVKLSLELSQDSANIESMLEQTLTGALAGAIDAAGLNGTTAGAPQGIISLAGNNVASIGAPTSWDFLTDGVYQLLLDNVSKQDIGAFIAHPAVWKKMSKLKTGIASDSTPLMMPSEIAAIPKLYTTAAPLTSGTTATGIIGDWRDLLLGIRREISIKVLSEAYMGSNLQVAVLAYARCDFVPTRTNSFCTLSGITV